MTTLVIGAGLIGSQVARILVERGGVGHVVGAKQQARP